MVTKAESGAPSTTTTVPASGIRQEDCRYSIPAADLFGGMAAGDYLWWVQAVNPNGQTSPWTPSAYRVVAPIPPPPVPEPEPEPESEPEPEPEPVPVEDTVAPAGVALGKLIGCSFAFAEVKTDTNNQPETVAYYRLAITRLDCDLRQDEECAVKPDGNKGGLIEEIDIGALGVVGGGLNLIGQSNVRRGEPTVAQREVFHPIERYLDAKDRVGQFDGEPYDDGLRRGDAGVEA